MQLVCPQKHQSFRPSKFELAVMDFNKIQWNFISYYDKIDYQLQNDMLWFNFDIL